MIVGWNQTPTHHTPAGEHRALPKNHRASVFKALYLVCALGGWALFVFEWVHVSSQTAHSDEIILVTILSLSLILIHLGTRSWIGHNRRVAAKGNRGSVTRYASPDFTHDSLGRLMVIDNAIHQSQEILISIEGDKKVYSSVEVPEVILK